MWWLPWPPPPAENPEILDPHDVFSNYPTGTFPSDLALRVSPLGEMVLTGKVPMPATWQDLVPISDGGLMTTLVVDLRGLGDFEKGHIIGSRHMLPSQVDPEGKLLAKAKESPVVVVCAVGVTASGVAQKLVKAGFKKVSVLDGGIGAWTAASLPLAKGKA